MHVAPFASNRGHWHPDELHQMRWYCCLKFLLSNSEVVVLPQHHGIRPWEGMRTGLAHCRASYEQISLSYMTLHDQRQISCRMDMWMEGTSFSGCSYGWARRRTPFCILTSMAMLLTNWQHPSSLRDRLPSAVLGSSSHGTAVGWCYTVLFWCWWIFLLEVMCCSISICAVLFWLFICSTICSVAVRKLANSWSATVKEISAVLPNHLSLLARRSDSVRRQCTCSYLWFLE